MQLMQCQSCLERCLICQGSSRDVPWMRHGCDARGAPLVVARLAYLPRVRVLGQIRNTRYREIDTWVGTVACILECSVMPRMCPTPSRSMQLNFYKINELPFTEAVMLLDWYSSARRANQESGRKRYI